MGRFTIERIEEMGDPEEGTNQKICINHPCGSLEVQFTRLLGGERPVVCSQCGEEVRVVKSRGRIFIVQ